MVGMLRAALPGHTLTSLWMATSLAAAGIESSTPLSAKGTAVRTGERMAPASSSCAAWLSASMSEAKSRRRAVAAASKVGSVDMMGSADRMFRGGWGASAFRRCYLKMFLIGNPF